MYYHLTQTPPIQIPANEEECEIEDADAILVIEFKHPKDMEKKEKKEDDGNKATVLSPAVAAVKPKEETNAVLPVA